MPISNKPEKAPVPPYAIAAGLTLLCLIPFANKAVHVDDTVYLWVAEQIRAEPFDFFGFEKNWYNRSEPMYDVNMNPPGISYLFALVSAVFGMNVIPLHMMQFAFAALAAAGVARLAKGFGCDPILAAAAAVLTPAVLVSATTLMCEPVLLACYVWALVFWIEGTEQKNFRALAFAGLIIGAGLLVKYIMITIIPLLAAYTLAVDRQRVRELAYLAIPLVMLAAYELYTFIRYDAGAFQVAISYALGTGRGPASIAAVGSSFLPRTFTTLAYLGGGFVTAAVLAPWLWNRRTLMYIAGGTLLVVAFFVSPLAHGLVSTMLEVTSREPSFGYSLQIGFWVACGLHVLGLTAYDLKTQRDPRSLILALLVFGMFVFSAYVNWSTNVRSLLPIAPALALLLTRQVARNDQPAVPWRGGIGLAAAAAVSMLVAWADTNAANADRVAAEELIAEYGDESETVWFMGRWGLRWYLDRAGLRALETEPLEVIPPPLQEVLNSNPGLHVTGIFEAEAGDYLIVAEHQSKYAPNPDSTELVEEFTYETALPVATHNFKTGGGFYATKLGVVPFAFGPVPPHVIRVYRFTRDIRTVILQ